MKNILEFLESSAALKGDKTAFADEAETLTYHELMSIAQSVGSCLAAKCRHRQNLPIAICMEKSVHTIAAMLGVVYSGNFYVILDCHMPPERINIILNSLSPFAIITEHAQEKQMDSIAFDGDIVFYEEASASTASKPLLAEIRSKSIDTDPLYALFTSGSTGIPKGAVLSHRNVIAYAEWVTEAFGISEKTVFGNQTPFYFSMSVLDIFSTLKNGASLHVIPKKLFSFPVKLLQFMNDRAVNTIYWVPSALSIVANSRILDYVKLPTLEKVLFAGEVMPTKQLNVWIRHMPGILYANLYGPTEVTDICTYYVVNRSFGDDEPLPIGRACSNCDVLVITDKNCEAAPGEEGELCVRGSFLAMGYYNNPEKTAQVFVQNPLNPWYPEQIYKTGDLVKYNKLGELLYITRKDFQIKHMGYRIELGEIETAASALPPVRSCVCIYDNAADKIILIYQGDASEEAVTAGMKEKLPRYMLPSLFLQIPQMPYNANGKIDRVWLRENYKTLK